MKLALEPLPDSVRKRLSLAEGNQDGAYPAIVKFESACGRVLGGIASGKGISCSLHNWSSTFCASAFSFTGIWEPPRLEISHLEAGSRNSDTALMGFKVELTYTPMLPKSKAQRREQRRHVSPLEIGDRLDISFPDLNYSKRKKIDGNDSLKRLSQIS